MCSRNGSNRHKNEKIKNEITVQSFLNEFELTANYVLELLLHMMRLILTERTEKNGNRSV